MTETDSNDKVEESLPFSGPKQEALLGYIILNDDFFNQVKHQIKPSWFVNPRHSQIFSAILAESAVLKRKLLPNELKECYIFRQLPQIDRSAILGVIDVVVSKTNDFGLDTLTPELTEWLKARVFLECLNKASDKFNSSKGSPNSLISKQRREEAYNTVAEMARSISGVNFEGDGEVCCSNIAKDLEGYQEEYKDALTFGITTLDRQLLPEANGKGSLLPGDMTVMLGPLNVGKTSCLLTVVAANVMNGKNVMLVIHEGRINDIKLKLYQSVCGLTKRDLFEQIRIPKYREGFDIVEKLLEDHLIYLPQIKAGLTVEELGSTIRRSIDRFSAKHNGEKVDLVVDDYLARLASASNGRGQLQKREKDQAVYEYGSTLAGECNFHLLTAIQVNRKANEINRRTQGSEDRLLVPTDVAEAIGPMFVASNVISINRSPIAQMKGRITYLICKTRSSEANIAVVCKSNYGICRTHSNWMGSTWYRGCSSMDERVDELLAQYQGSEIPEALVLKSD